MLDRTRHVTHAEALRALDARVHLAVKARDCTAPPDQPAEGDRYIVPSSATGVWTGYGDRIALWHDQAWQMYVPGEGWLARVGHRCDGEDVVFDGQSWRPARAHSDSAQSELRSLSLVGRIFFDEPGSHFVGKCSSAAEVAADVSRHRQILTRLASPLARVPRLLDR